MGSGAQQFAFNQQNAGNANSTGWTQPIATYCSASSISNEQLSTNKA